jgi:RNA polymerase sigma factor (TIGR02999 family)
VIYEVTVSIPNFLLRVAVGHTYRCYGRPHFFGCRPLSQPVIYGIMDDVTQILNAIDAGDEHAAVQLLPLVYQELRKLAAQKLAQEKPGHTLQATALVHEAYLRLVGTGNEQHWNSRGHFFAAAAEAMRRILVEHARRKHRQRHGGEHQRVPFDGVDIAAIDRGDDLLALDEALGRFAEAEPVAAQVIKLRYFAGLTIEQTAEALAISVRTANRHFAFAKAWLFQQLRSSSVE